MKKSIYTITAAVLTALTFSANAQIISTVAGTGIAGNTGDGGAATAAQMDSPYGIAVDGTGNIYFADVTNRTVRKVSSSGTITSTAGNPLGVYPGDGGAATAASIDPYDVAVDGSGNVFIADYSNHRIRKVTPTGVISTIAGTGTSGATGIGGPATAAKLHFPIAVAVDAAGNLFIADRTNHMIKKVTATTGFLTVVAGTNVAGFSGDGGAAYLAQLDQPLDIALDATGNLYVADYVNNRIRKIDVSGNISTFAGDGTPAHTGDGGPATAAQLDYPVAVGTDALGNVYITEGSSNKVRVVNASGIISTFAGNGTAGFSGDGGVATSAELNTNKGVASDASGNIYICDKDNHRIRKVTGPGALSVVSLPGETTSLKVYPNPSTGTFTIDLPQGTTTAFITINDILGKVVATRSATNAAQLNFDLGNVPAGTYIAKIAADNKTYRSIITVTK